MSTIVAIPNSIRDALNLDQPTINLFKGRVTVISVLSNEETRYGQYLYPPNREGSFNGGWRAPDYSKPQSVFEAHRTFLTVNKSPPCFTLNNFYAELDGKRCWRDRIPTPTGNVDCTALLRFRNSRPGILGAIAFERLMTRWDTTAIAFAPRVCVMEDAGFFYTGFDLSTYTHRQIPTELHP